MAVRDSINSKIFKGLKISEKSGIPVLFMANPGTGKTTTVNMYAKLRNYEVVELHGNSCMAEEIAGYDCAPTEILPGQTTSAQHLRPKWFQEVLDIKAQGKRVLLFLDEITTAPLNVQAALLKIIQERKVYGENIPADTLIVAAGNYAENLGPTMSMLAPTMNRFCIINIIPEQGDIKDFLCRYHGAGGGKQAGEEQTKQIEAALRKLDSLEKTYTEEQKNAIGDLFEIAIRRCAESLSTSKRMDLSVTDVSQIFSENADRLYGFPTLRTLGFLVDAAIASYTCFGKEGITSDTFRDICDGLVGLGLTKDGKNNTKTELIGIDFFTQCNQILSQIDHLGNDVIIDMEKKILSIIPDGSKAEIADVNIIINKINEIDVNKKTKDLIRPLKSETIAKILKYARTSAATLFSSVSSTSGSVANLYTAEELATKINTFNCYTQLYNLMKKFLEVKSYIGDSTSAVAIKEFDNLKEFMSLNISKLRGYKKIFIASKADESAILPEITSLETATAEAKKSK